MTTAPIDGLARLSDATCADLRALFATAGFTPALIAEAEAFIPGVLTGPRLPAIRWWLSRRTEAGGALARLFMYHDTLPTSEARVALGGGDLLDALRKAGVVADADGGADRDGGGAGHHVAARFTITPCDDEIWLLCDSLEAGPNAVMGQSGGTQHLGRLVPRPFAGAALDLGCGAGSLALVAARRGARRAVGVDVNPRAIHIAHFNARLNGLAAEFYVGNAVDPVASERFDLVLSQPPFVVRPPDQPDITYLYGGPTGDELPRHFVGQIPHVLAPGGRGLVLLQSPERDGQPLAQRIRAALHGAAVDLLVIGTKAPPPSVQASVFASLHDPSLGDHYATTVRRYLDHFEAQGLRQFTGATVVLQLPAEPVPRDGRFTIGLKLSESNYDLASLDQFLRGLDLIGLPPALFERARLRFSPHARLAEITGPNETAEAQVAIRVEAPGIGTEWAASREDLLLLDTISDGDSLGAALDTRARSVRSDGASAALVRAALLDFARQALVKGTLVRADD